LLEWLELAKEGLAQGLCANVVGKSTKILRLIAKLSRDGKI